MDSFSFFLISIGGRSHAILFLFGIDAFFNAVYTNLSNGLYVEKEVSMMKILLVVILLICVDTTYNFKFTYLYKVIANMEFTAREYSLRKFSSASLDWLDDPEHSIEKQRSAMDIGLAHLGSLIHPISTIIDTSITTLVMIAPVFWDLGWSSVFLISSNLLFFWFYMRPMQRQIDIDKEIDSAKRKKERKELNQSYYLYRERIIHGQKDYSDLIGNTGLLHYYLRLKYQLFYLIRTSFPSVVQYALFALAIRQGNFGSASIILRNKSSISQLLNNLVHLEKELTTYTTEIQPLLDLLNSIKSAEDLVSWEAEPENLEQFDLRMFNILEISNISLRRGNFHLNQSDKLNISLEDRERILVCGDSGFGKTTFLKLLAGFYADAKVLVKLDDLKLNSMGHFISSRSFNQTQQEHIELNTSWLRFITNDLSVDKKLVERIINWVQLKTRINSEQIGGVLSDGEKTRLLLAQSLYRAVICENRILIMDEPDRGLSDSMAFEILSTIFNEFPGCIFITLHRDRCLGGEIKTLCPNCDVQIQAQWVGLPFTQKIIFETSGKFIVG